MKIFPSPLTLTPIVFLLATGVMTGRADLPADPLFDWDAILNDPTETVILSEDRTDGIVFRTIVFTCRKVGGNAERIQGILAFAEDGGRKPGLFWSMGGMAAANRFFPGLFAKNGWACLAITLPHSIRQSFTTPFNASNPSEANLTLLARDQLRGITVLSQQPEVDPERLAVAGASYGGVFATLIAGADPRIKAGMSFFGGGYHELGTSLPQFLRMSSLENLAVWNRTIDPAFRLARRPIPFIWGVAFNDHWFHFPAVIRTFLDAAGTEKRLIIMPHWQHGFPPHVDETLVRFLDTTPIAPRPIPPYNNPAPIRLRVENNKVIASFDWTGVRPVVKAELVASYGDYTPWLGWPHRAAFIFPAGVSNTTAEAVLPIPSRRLPVVVWGTITDTNHFAVSTPPMILETNCLVSLPVTKPLSLNAFPFETFDESVLAFYRGCGDHVQGEIARGTDGNKPVALWRISPSPKSKDPDLALSLSLFHHVPGVAHRLSIRIRTEPPTTLSLALIPQRPTHWQYPIVRHLVEQNPLLASLLPTWDIPPQPFQIQAEVGNRWSEVTLDVPLPSEPVDGYRFEIRQTPMHTSVIEISAIRMEPLWSVP